MLKKANYTKSHYRKFINDSYVACEGSDIYDVVSNVNEEIYVRVNMANGGVIIENESLDIDNDAKIQLLLSKVDDFIKDNESEDTNDYDYEYVGEAASVYGNGLY